MQNIMQQVVEFISDDGTCFVKIAFNYSKGVQIPTRIPEKIVVALFSGIVVNSGIQVEAGRHMIVNVKLKLKAQ